MAGTSLLALIDDIASILDDVATMTKVAAKKTSGVLGDDLALNTQQVSGVSADRELPVVWKVAKGSFVNKLILIPLALILSQFIPWAVQPLLIIGGLFLCYEGFEKVQEKFLIWTKKIPANVGLSAASLPVEVSENEKIKGAVRTDFILSAEIIVITLGGIATQPFLSQVLVLSSISVAMTVGVYGLVALIVKIDDIGLWLLNSNKEFMKISGQFLLKLAPVMLKLLGFLGTIAMFLVGGGLINHSIPLLHHLQENIDMYLVFLLDGGIGFFAGAIVYLLLLSIRLIRIREYKQN